MEKMLEELSFDAPRPGGDADTSSTRPSCASGSTIWFRTKTSRATSSEAPDDGQWREDGRDTDPRPGGRRRALLPRGDPRRRSPKPASSARRSRPARRAWRPRASPRVGVVVLDVTLPDMSGIDVLRRLRASGPTPRVIVLSSHTDQELVLEALRIGASTTWRSPCTDEELILAVRGRWRHTPVESSWPRCCANASARLEARDRGPGRPLTAAERPCRAVLRLSRPRIAETVSDGARRQEGVDPGHGRGRRTALQWPRRAVTRSRSTRSIRWRPGKASRASPCPRTRRSSSTTSMPTSASPAGDDRIATRPPPSW